MFLILIFIMDRGRGEVRIVTLPAISRASLVEDYWYIYLCDYMYLYNHIYMYIKVALSWHQVGPVRFGFASSQSLRTVPSPFFFLRDSRPKPWQLGWSLCGVLPMLCRPMLRRLTGSMRTLCASQQNGRTQESPSLPTNMLDGTDMLDAWWLIRPNRWWICIYKTWMMKALQWWPTRPNQWHRFTAQQWHRLMGPIRPTGVPSCHD